jgi:DNA gyrase subunit A
MLSKKLSYTKIANLKENDEFIAAMIASDNDEVLIASEQGKYVRFPLNVVRPSGKTARGVIAMKLGEEDTILTMIKVSDSDDLVIVSEKGIGRKTKASEYTASKNKAGKGFNLYKANSRTGAVAAVIAVQDHNLLITTASGTVIRLDSTKLNHLGKAAMGVKLINIEDNDKVSSIAKIVPENEEEEINADN